MGMNGPVIKIKGDVFEVRGQKVVPVSAAAAFYGVSPGVLMRAVRRNQRRFTREFMFRLGRRDQMAIAALEKQKKSAIVFTGGEARHCPWRITR
jgi:hypothetical protein